VLVMMSPHCPCPQGAVLIFLPGVGEISRLVSELSSRRELWVLPLHGSLSGQDQAAVFRSPPKGKKKIVVCAPRTSLGLHECLVDLLAWVPWGQVATNVAETSSEWCIFPLQPHHCVVMPVLPLWPGSHHPGRDGGDRRVPREAERLRPREPDGVPGRGLGVPGLHPPAARARGQGPTGGGLPPGGFLGRRLNILFSSFPCSSYICSGLDRVSRCISLRSTCPGGGDDAMWSIAVAGDAEDALLASRALHARDTAHAARAGNGMVDGSGHAMLSGLKTAFPGARRTRSVGVDPDIKTLCVQVLLQVCSLATSLSLGHPEQFFASMLDPPNPRRIAAALATLTEVQAIREPGEGEEGEEDGKVRRVLSRSRPSVSAGIIHCCPGYTDAFKPTSGLLAPDAKLRNGYSPPFSLQPSGQDASPRLTPLGKHLAALPCPVRLGKMLVFGAVLGVLDPILSVAAGLVARSPFVSTANMDAERKAGIEEAKAK
jgi:hypothetical protein